MFQVAQGRVGQVMMKSDERSDRFGRAIAAIDAANALDPNTLSWNGESKPKELLHSSDHFFPVNFFICHLALSFTSQISRMPFIATKTPRF